MTRKDLFRRTLEAAPGRLHFAAHSHHPWPDVSFDAQQEAWLDAARHLDRKWDKILGEVYPACQRHVARILGLSDPRTVAFGPNTHDFVVRILSCLPPGPVPVLTTDGEFLSFSRQCRRWEELGRVNAERVPVEPFETFPDRFLERVRSREHALVYVSQVFFDSGFVFDRFDEVADAAADEAFVVIDGYHGFFALPTHVGPVERRVFYLAGGYKYAMSGEGVCFLHAPPGFGDRPVDTGWYAGFGSLEDARKDEVPYARDGSRFLGATFDPSGLYRFRAVMDLWERERVDPAAIHAHVRALQLRFLERLDGIGARELHSGRLVPHATFPDRGNFLAFRGSAAADLAQRLRLEDVTVDHRADRLRFGFGIYQDEADVDELAARLGRLLG